MYCMGSATACAPEFRFSIAVVQQCQTHDGWFKEMQSTHLAILIIHVGAYI